MRIFAKSNQIIFKALDVIMRDVPFLHAHGVQVRSHSETLDEHSLHLGNWMEYSLLDQT